LCDIPRGVSGRECRHVRECLQSSLLLEHGYIKRDFDVHAWAAPEFPEKAGKELIEERWEKATAAKLPEATVVRLG
jgi:hypothetical protein